MDSNLFKKITESLDSPFIIIDNSASMSVTNNQQSFLDQSKKKIPEILSSFGGLVNLNVFMTTPPNEIYSGIVEKGMNLQYQNWQIAESYGKDNLWTLVDSLLSSIDSSLPNKECFILSDFPIEPMNNFKDDFTLPFQVDALRLPRTYHPVGRNR